MRAGRRAENKPAAVEQLLLEHTAAVDTLRAAKHAADERRKVAEKFAAAVIARAQSRGAVVAASQALYYDGVRREAWGRW